MTTPIDLAKWYWLADDGRVFSAERSIVVDDEDAEYVAWAASNVAAPWPRDSNGVQSEIILQAALAPFDLGILLLSYAEQALYKRMQGGFQLDVDTFVATNDRLVAIILNARMAVTVDPLWTTPFVWDDGSIGELGETEIMGLSTALLNFQRDCLAKYAEVKLAINANTITTRAQVDAEFAEIV